MAGFRVGSCFPQCYPKRWQLIGWSIGCSASREGEHDQRSDRERECKNNSLGRRLIRHLSHPFQWLTPTPYYPLPIVRSWWFKEAGSSHNRGYNQPQSAITQTGAVLVDLPRFCVQFSVRDQRGC